MIQRHFINKLLEFINKSEKNKNVLIVDGVRQVGKTTAVYQALQESKKDYLAINLEKEKSFCHELDNKTIEFHQFQKLLFKEYRFTPGQNKILFIDEANESQRLGFYVRQMKEDWENQTVILTGSMMNRLFRDKDVRIPVGRYETLTVWPFSFGEFLTANEQIASPLRKYGLAKDIQDPELVSRFGRLEHEMLLKLLDHYLNCGGLPKIVMAYLNSGGEANISELIVGHLENLKQDFFKYFSIEYANFFDRALGSVANLLGQPYKKTALIKNNNRLAENILSIFEHWKLILKIEQKSPSPTISNSLYPKRYLFDVGVSRFKREGGIPSISILETLNFAQREPLGGLIEQLACVELTKQFFDFGGFKEENYEVDFILKWKNEVIPVECKASLKPNQNQYRGLDLYNQRYQNKKAVVLSLAPFSKVQRQGYEILHVPIYAVGCLREMVKDRL